jgi:hypothetical protein
MDACVFESNFVATIRLYERQKRTQIRSTHENEHHRRRMAHTLARTKRRAVVERHIL